MVVWDQDWWCPGLHLLWAHILSDVCPEVAHVTVHSILLLRISHEIPVVDGWTFQPFLVWNYSE